MRMDLNLPALERLLGGDTELELNLRHQIVEQFTKHHLKQLLNNELFQKIQEWWNGEMSKHVAEQVGVNVRTRLDWFGRGDTEFVLADAIKAAIRKQVEQEVDTLVKDRIQQYREAWLKRDVEHMEKVVTRALDQDLEKRVQDEVQRRLKAAAEMKP